MARTSDAMGVISHGAMYKQYIFFGSVRDALQPIWIGPIPKAKYGMRVCADNLRSFKLQFSFNNSMMDASNAAWTIDRDHKFRLVALQVRWDKLLLARFAKVLFHLSDVALLT